MQNNCSIGVKKSLLPMNCGSEGQKESWHRTVQFCKSKGRSLRRGLEVPKWNWLSYFGGNQYWILLPA